MRNAALRTCLLLIVLLNLAFVHITGQVGLDWLLPLYLLVLASPWLARWQENLAYRTVWNLSVLALFLVLVRHAAWTEITSLLEDGLTLAAFCQVHLLNNLNRQQRPDLMFFNSFLIALVTCSFCQDLVYSIVFALYALVLVIGMQIACVSWSGAQLAAGDVAMLARDGARRAAVALALTLVVFMVWPRDFQREGFVSETFRISTGGNLAQVDFSEGVRLGQHGQTLLSDHEIMRVHVLRGDPTQVPPHLRGSTMVRYERQEWRPERRSPNADSARIEAPWRARRDRTWERGAQDHGVRLRVQLLDPQAARLFLPLESTRLAVQLDSDPLAVQALRDGTIQFPGGIAYAFADRALEYDVELRAAGKSPSGAVRQPPPAALLEYAVLDRSAPQRIRDMADQIVRALPARAPQHVLVERMRARFASFRYALPGEPGAALNLDHFLTGRAGGHCQYFATALALMLRTQSIPCRLVNGYLAQEWDEADRCFVVRSKNAHTWVEVFDPEAGWYTVDPTPSADASAGHSFLAGLATAATELWKSVTRFDEKARAAAIQWIVALPERTLEAALQHPFSTTGILLGALALLWLRRARRRLRHPPAVRSYLAALRELRVATLDGETPRETLVRAAASLPPERLQVLEQATRVHESERYLMKR